MEEIWKPITGWEYYEASNTGRIRSKDRHVSTKGDALALRKGKVLKQASRKDKYMRIDLVRNGEKSTHYVHRLVALAFHGPSEKHVNHINGNRSDNRIENLEFVSARENLSHGVKRAGRITMMGAHYSKKDKIWRAVVGVNRKSIALGRFPTEIQAHQAYMNYLKENNLENKYAE